MEELKNVLYNQDGRALPLDYGAQQAGPSGGMKSIGGASGNSQQFPGRGNARR
jgi:hypothetical protein